MSRIQDLVRVQEVWAHNLDQEMRNIREIVDEYPFIAMDTEFPGVVARPIGAFKTSSDYHYQTMRCNVDLLKIIQVGLTFTNERGQTPPDTSTWQFNFRFSVNDDMFVPDHLDNIQKSSNIDLQRHEELGILPQDFAEMMITSGLVLTQEPKWISFHSGYDFGYWVKLLTSSPLPTSEDEFFNLLSLWFPTVYDIKCLLRAAQGPKGNLHDVAEEMQITQVGSVLQAGSGVDSWVAAGVFWRTRELYFPDGISDSEFNGKLYGLGQTFTPSSVLTDPTRTGATIAEREDRTVRDDHTQNATGGPTAALNFGSGPIPTPALAGALPSGMTPGPYGPMTGGPYIRVGGR